MQVAVQRPQLGPDPVERILRALAIGDDQQVILRDDVVGQPDLVEEELQARLEPDAIELELHGVIGVNVLTTQRGEVEDDGDAERLLQTDADLGEGCRPIEREPKGPQQDVLDRPGGRWSRRKSGGGWLISRIATALARVIDRLTPPRSTRVAPIGPTARSCAGAAIRPDANRPSRIPASSNAPT